MANDGPTSHFHTANTAAAKTDWLVGALDEQAANVGVQRLRAWAHAAVGARPGDLAVDVGAGTGSETRVLAAAVGAVGDEGPGEAVGIEPNDGLRAVAQQRAEEARSNARFVPGDALALPFDDASRDIVWSERVLQHLGDPEAAVAEYARILRPGGRIVLLDTDWATTILHPGDPAVVAVLEARSLKAPANPFAGRRLRGQLAAAGFEITDVGSQALLHGGDTLPWELVRMLAEGAVADGELDAEQRDMLYADLAAGAERGDVHLSVTMFGAAARKPG
jgi:SAM-dependent methyltransferase